MFNLHKVTNMPSFRYHLCHLSLPSELHSFPQMTKATRRGHWGTFVGCCVSCPLVEEYTHLSNNIIVGISIAISIPLLIIAFNVTWLTKPWFYIRRIWIKKVLIQLSHPLRHIPVISVRSKIYRRIAKWSDSIY